MEARMKDLLLTRNGDLYVNPATGDIEITDSVEQAIRIRLLWFWREWRLGPEKGIPYWEEVFVKNPNKLRVRQLFREAIMEVAEVESVEDLQATIDTATRLLTVKYRAKCKDGAEISGEVHLNA
jgi:hypothetical protein